MLPWGQPKSAQVTAESSKPPLLPAVHANRMVLSLQTALPRGKNLSASSKGWIKHGAGRAGLSSERRGVLLARWREAPGGAGGAPKATSPRGLELQAGFSRVDPSAQVPVGCSGRATLPGTAAWEPGGCSGAVACTGVCWAAGSGGGVKCMVGGRIGEVPLLQHPSVGRGGAVNLPTLPSPHLRRWLLEGWRLHDFGRPVAVVPLLLLGQVLLHQVNVTAGGDGGVTAPGGGIGTSLYPRAWGCWSWMGHGEHKGARRDGKSEGKGLGGTEHGPGQPRQHHHGWPQ